MAEDGSSLQVLVNSYFENLPVPKFQRAAALGEKKPAGGTFNTELLFPALNTPDVLSFLAPQDILSLWRCCKTTWNQGRKALPLQARRNVMLKSAFKYLFISQEAADQVDASMQGGWQGDFLLRLVSLCDFLAHRIYAPFEPDPAHRAWLAEACCFHNSQIGRRGNLLRCASIDEIMELEDPPEPQRLPVPTLDQLHVDVGWQILWGDPNDGILEDISEEYWRANQKWMQEHVSQAPQQYQERLRLGLEPIIWLMYDGNAETEQYGCGIGPNREQIIDRRCFYSEGREGGEHGWFLCVQENHAEHDVDETTITKGILQFLVKWMALEAYDEELTEHAGAVVWAFRKGFLPGLSEDDIRAALTADGLTTTSFLVRALQMELFGPAKVEEYIQAA